MEILLSLIAEIFLPIFILGIGYAFGFFPVIFFTLGTISPAPIEHIDETGAFNSKKDIKFWHLTYTDKDKKYVRAGIVVLTDWSLIGTIAATCFLAFHLAGL